jgi:hypothetical protein
MGRFCGIDPSLIDEVLSEDKGEDSRHVARNIRDKEEACKKNREESLHINPSDGDANKQGG